jgi:biopolymer transport protein ExbD
MKLEAKKMEAEIPTCSMADIAFLLITFFMVTAVFSQNRGMDFTIPAEAEQPDSNAQSEEAVHIRVTEAGQICLDGKAAAAEQILDYLKPKLERWPNKPIIVTTEPLAPYEGFISVYDELRLVDLPVKEGGLGLARPNISIPSLQEIEQLKRLFGEDIFGAEAGGCS